VRVRFALRLEVFLPAPEHPPELKGLLDIHVVLPMGERPLHVRLTEQDLKRGEVPIEALERAQPLRAGQIAEP